MTAPSWISSARAHRPAAIGLLLVLSVASAPGGEVSAEGSGRQQASEVRKTAVVECGAPGDGCVPGMSVLVQQVAKAARSSYEIVVRHAALETTTVVPGASVVGGLAAVGSRVAHEAAAASQRQSSAIDSDVDQP